VGKNQLRRNKNMRTIQIKVSETDFQKYNLGEEEIKFTDLVEMISQEYARKALLEANEIAEQVGLSKMTLDEIDAEIKAVRNAKNHS
jgi:hypothetical protein